MTPLVNNQRGQGHGSETHCPQGHPYAGDNLYVRPRDNGRMCRICQRAALRRFHERKVA